MSLKLFDVSSKVALVTGGSKGLGKSMARALALAGADLVISSRHQDELESALPDILVGTNRRGIAIVADLSKKEEAERLAKAAIEGLGRIDILVNNAGTNIPQPIDHVEDEDWNRVLTLNLSACMALTRALVPPMKQRRWGRIIHISSVLGLGSKAGRSSYSATKAGLIGLAQASALDLGRFGITVNCIAPGPFLTDLARSLHPPANRQNASDRTALGRWGDPDELMGPILLLASDAGSYITGTVLVVDGGVMAHVL